jgi:hypothetical protein
MTKATPTDFDFAVSDIATTFGYELRHTASLRNSDPLTWQVEIARWQQHLKTMSLLTSLWQDRLDHDAEADRQAKREEEISDLY